MGRRHGGRDSVALLRAGAGVSGTQCPGWVGEGVTHSLSTERSFLGSLGNREDARTF